MIETPLEHSFERTNGIRLHVAKAGPEDGELVILIHGFPDFWYGWQHQIDHLAKLGYRVWIPDQRGYNLSTKVQGIDNYKGADLANDIAGLIDAAGRDQAYVVGHDWGALTAWYTALFHPERVKKLVCIAAPHPQVLANTLFHDRDQQKRMWYVWFFQLPYIPERILSLNNWQWAVNMLDLSGRPDTFTDPELEFYREAYAQTEAMTCMINYYRAFVQMPRSIPTSWRVSMPVRLIWGRDDKFLKHQMAVDSMAYCDDGQMLVFDASHWVPGDAWHEVNQLLEDFLR